MKDRMFPIIFQGSHAAEQRELGCPKSVPWSMVEPYEEQAQNNHGQSLKRLAERGGLSPIELCGVMTGKGWHDLRKISVEFAVKHVLKCLRDHEYESENRVSFASDAGPDDDQTPRIHILAADDYYLYVSQGFRHSRLSFRACTSGARNPNVTFWIAALYKYGRGDYEGAAACARIFIKDLGENHEVFSIEQAPTDDLVNELRKRQVLQELKQMPETLDGVYVHVQERDGDD